MVGTSLVVRGRMAYFLELKKGEDDWRGRGTSWALDEGVRSGNPAGPRLPCARTQRSSYISPEGRAPFPSWAAQNGAPSSDAL